MIVLLLTICIIIIYTINYTSNYINNIIYGFIGIILSELSTIISILICEKNSKLVGGLALMTSILDFSGTICNAFLQLYVYNNLNLYLTISTYSFFIVFLLFIY